MLEIIYQDESIVAINKPAGWLVHRSWLDRHEKVVIMQTLRDQLDQHVFTVHRLDRPTSGVLLFALSSDVARTMSQQFEHHRVHKTYHAVVRGYIDQAGEIDYALTEQADKIADKFSSDKFPQRALTRYRCLSKFELPLAVGRYETARYSLVELTPTTGRKHQLRRHMKHVFHPIIGDTTYGDLHQNRAFASHFGAVRLMLHAAGLSFHHPLTQELIQLNAKGDSDWQQATAAFCTQ